MLVLNTAHNFHTISQLPNRTIEIDGQQFLYFSGTAYLGLAQNPAFQKAIREAQGVYGSVYGSSRNGNVQLEVYEKAESRLASWTGAEAALTLSSGMLAGQAVVRQLMLEDYEFIYSPDAHPAVWHLPQVNFAESFEAIITQINHLPNSSKIAIVTNSVDALRGKIHDFDWVKQLPENQDITLVIDDSHGLGIIGQDCSGIFKNIPQKPNVRLIITASLGKAMSLPGGVIFSDSQTIQNIRNSAFFGGCSPIAPDHLHAFLQTEELYKIAQKRLKTNTLAFSKKVQSLNIFKYTSDFPVFYTDHDELYDFLLSKNILIYSFAYPKPTDKANTRIVISAWHSTEDIEILAEACQAFYVKNKTLSLFKNQSKL